MHERKALIAELADGFIALPGGFALRRILRGAGVEPLVITKTVRPAGRGGLLSSSAAFFDHAVAEGFIRPKHRELVMVEEERKSCCTGWKPSSRQ